MGFRVSPHVLVAGAALCLASGALATDGVIEINQAKALAGFVTPGDTVPGFPVTLSVGGSYRLTSNLDVTVAGMPAEATAIVVFGSPDSVSIDLNGFAILGPNTCGMSCTAPGNGHGVSVSGGTPRFVHVRNGSVVGMGGRGIFVPSGLIENVTVAHNGFGIFMNSGSVVHSTARNNGSVGIEVETGSVLGSTSTNNLSDGIRAKYIVDCLAMANQGDGFEVHVSGGSVLDSVSDTNTLFEVNCVGSCALRGNHFVGCPDPSTCMAGARLQIPLGSNMCNTVVCP